ncbi:MAG TPA: hybrid sensor histidine kinase/response regulator [Polyangia bacterium]|nr:hybrid sensor histidine kinase/response regulator [Polyangia bacterium]
MATIAAALSRQPAWSDLPILLLASGDPLAAENARAVSNLRRVGNVTILERPVRTLTLTTAVQAALRARRRQYEIRALIRGEADARTKAEKASKLKDEFLATVSHELRTPLGAILLWTRLLRARHLDAAATQRALESLEHSAEAQSKLIEDLLDASRIVSGKLRLKWTEVNLSTLAHAAVDVVWPGAEDKRVDIETDIEPDILVRADADRLKQVFWNLLSNAIKFTPGGGRVFVRVGRTTAHARIDVSDTGRGISPEFLPQVFERFRQAESMPDRTHGGLGLGLAISRDLVVLHGGTIRADSPGQGLGAVFTVELPVATAADTGSAKTIPAGDAALGRLAGVRIMLVEDDTSTREAMAITLGHYGAEVTSFDSAQAALAVLSDMQSGNRPQVLLTDLALSGMSGDELLERIRNLEQSRGLSAMPAVLISAYARTDGREPLAGEADFAAELRKPVAPERLAGVIEQVSGQIG